MCEEIRIGDKLAERFEIVSVIGQGSMGVVYKCHDTVMDTVVAIKTLRLQGKADERQHLRFQAEARAAGRLRHQNLIRVHDFGYTNDGMPFLVMDFVAGEPLFDILKREKRWHYLRAVNLFSQVAEGLFHAHERGVIHRDLKPANLMVTSAPNGCEAVTIVDLGVAKILRGADDTDGNDTLTRTGEICGSPVYLSPEQCMYEELDGKTDIYSLGVCLYESILGTVPIRGVTVHDTIRMHVYDNPKSFAELAPELEIPLQLETVILKALSKKPADRFEDMRRLKIELLAAIGIAEPIAATQHAENSPHGECEDQAVSTIDWIPSNLQNCALEHSSVCLSREQTDEARETIAEPDHDHGDHHNFYEENPPESNEPGFGAVINPDNLTQNKVFTSMSLWQMRIGVSVLVVSSILLGLGVGICFSHQVYEQPLTVSSQPTNTPVSQAYPSTLLAPPSAYQGHNGSNSNSNNSSYSSPSLLQAEPAEIAPENAPPPVQPPIKISNRVRSSRDDFKKTKRRNLYIHLPPGAFLGRQNKYKR